MGEAGEAKCRSASTGPSRYSGSLTLCWTDSNDLLSRRCAMFLAVPVTRLSTQTTVHPSTSSRSQRCDPRKPAPPVTTARKSGTADAPVDEAAFAHRLGVEDVAAVDDHRTAHQAFDPIEVELAKLVPLGDDEQRVRTGGHGVGVLAILDRVHLRPEDRHRLGVVSADVGAFLHQVLDDVDRGCLADVVGVWLVRQSQDADHLAAQPPKDFAQFLDD